MRREKVPSHIETGSRETNIFASSGRGSYSVEVGRGMREGFSGGLGFRTVGGIRSPEEEKMSSF